VKAILTYHDLDSGPSPITVAPEIFVRHLDELVRAGVAVLPLLELIDSPASRAVAITFDDGFASFAEHAWPELRRRGLPVTLFVVSGHAGATNAWGGRQDLGIPVRPLLDWPTLRELAREGVSLGSHTASHAALPGLPPERVETELREARERIRSETGSEALAFAYPFGAVDTAACAAARRHHRCAVTTELRMIGVAEDPHRLPRLDAWYFRKPGRLAAFGRASFTARVAFRRALRRVRAGVRSLRGSYP
jgi:peptidoglycan/xylan/chitin deacetylase (PgdA/CDA1 family)